MAAPKPQPITLDEIKHRFGFHKATEQTGPMHATVRKAFISMAQVIVRLTPPGREQSLALTSLQEAAQWTNAAVAMQAPLVEEE